jgi:sugar phosphate permease
VREKFYLDHRAQLTTCSGFVNGIVAYGVSFIHVKLESWRILFMIEGGATVLIAIIAIIVLPDDIQSCKWFTAEEKDYCEHTWRRIEKLTADTW